MSMYNYTGKSKCEKQRANAKGDKSDRFVPQCEKNGNYRQIQCDKSVGSCWCVDEEGNERPGITVNSEEEKSKCDRVCM